MKDITKADLLKSARIIRGNNYNYSEMIIKKTKYNFGLLMEFRNEVEKIKEDLLRAASVLHGVDPEVLTNDDELNTFIYKSRLWGGKTEHMPVNSIIYKGRFIVCVFKIIYTDILDIVAFLSGKTDTAHHITFITQVRHCLADFVENFANNKDCSEQLMKINELFICLDKSASFNSKAIKNKAKLIRELNHLDKMLQSGFLSQRPDDYVIIQNVLLASFMATSIGDYKNTFIVKEETTFKNEESIKDVVTSLGKCLNREKYTIQHPFTTLFISYTNARPLLKFKWNVNEDNDLQLGCEALSFLYFISGSKRLKKIIKDMIY